MSDFEIIGKIHCDEKSGLNVTDNLVALSKKCSKAIAWESATLSFEYFSGDYGLAIELDPWCFILDEANGRVMLSRYICGNYMAAWDVEFSASEKIAVRINCTSSHAEICVNGKTMSYDATQPSRMTLTYIHFAPNSRFTNPKIETVEIPEPCVDELCNAGNEIKLEFTVDFYDDLIVTDYDSARLDDMFKSMADIGAKRAYWIDHGKRDNGFWDSGPIETQVRNAAKSFDQLGDDFVAAAVRSAHNNNMELVGIIKPFDTAIVHSTESYKSDKGRGDALGGRLTQAFSFPAQHPELCMKRRNLPQKPNGIGKIEITSRKILPQINADNIELWVSDDNSTYIRYAGPASIISNNRQVIIESLKITEKFIAIKLSQKLAEAVTNISSELAKVYDLYGNVIEFTYGIVPRRIYKQAFHLDRKIELLNFVEHGMNFDNAGTGIPSAVWNWCRVDLDLYSPSANMNVLGIAAAINPVVPGVLSESEPKVHDFWLAWVNQLLDSGVDGVEIRVQNHGNIFDWSQYGFNAPVVEEYRKRWGVNIIKEKYDAGKLQELRGEFFTEFLRKASALTRSRDKKFRIHIEDMHSGPTSEPCPMGIHLPWQKWIDENLVDGVTLKLLNHKAYMTAFGRDVLSACRKKNIPVTLTPFFHSVTAMSPQDWDCMLNFPFAAFNVYEYATVMKAAENGTVKPIIAEHIEMIKKLLCKY